MDPVSRESTRLLENDPRKAVQDARTNLQTMHLLAKSWSDFPDTIRFGILDTFSYHLNSVNPLRNAHNSSQQSIAREGAYLTIAALYKISKFLEPSLHPDMNEIRLAALIPGLLQWSVYLYTAEAGRPTIPGQSVWENAKFIVRAWHELTHSEAVAETMVHTDGVVELAAKLWRLEQAFPGDETSTAYPWATSLVTVLLRQGGADTVLRLVKGATDDTSGQGIVAELTMSRLKTWTRSLSTANRMAVIFYLDIIDSISRDKDLLLRNHFLNKHKVIPFCSNTALRVAQLLDDNPQSASPPEGPQLLTILTHSFNYLGNYLNSTDGFTWVLQAINADILKAFVLSSQHFHLLQAKERNMVFHPILNVIPQYMAYRSVTTAINTALRELDEPRYRRLVENSIVKNEWANFRMLVARRIHAVEMAKATKGKIEVCNNVGCRKTDNKSTFRKCAGCNITLYCSKECQITAWNYNHKEMCKAKQEEYLQGKKHEFHRVDEHFFHFLPTHDVNSNWIELRRQASNPAFQGVKGGGFLVSIDYTMVPEVYTVKPLSWHDWRSELTSDFGSRDGHSHTAHPMPGWREDQNDETVDEARRNPDKLTLIQSAVKNGESVQLFVTLMPVSVFYGL